MDQLEINETKEFFLKALVKIREAGLPGLIGEPGFVNAEKYIRAAESEAGLDEAFNQVQKYARTRGANLGQIVKRLDEEINKH